jgi:plasmid stabilization system protein ParE
MTRKKKPALLWRPQAEAELLELIDYLADRNPRAVQALHDEILDKVRALPDHPCLYQVSKRAPGYRQLTVRRNFLVYYILDDETVPTVISIVAVVHAAEDRQPNEKRF